MKHIVIIGKYYPPDFGGVERYTSELAHAVADRHRVTVIAHSRGADDSIEQDGNVTVIRCGTATTVSSQPVSPSMLKHLRGFKPDLVHFNAPNFWGAAMLAMANDKAPVVITHHADVFGRPLLRRVVMPLYRRLARQAACVVVNSLQNAEASNDLPHGSTPFIEIPYGADPRLFDIDETRRADAAAERRQRFGTAPVVGFVGRFVRYKGLSVLIDALTQVEGVHALLIGNGPLRSQIEQQVRAANLGDRVHFFGEVDEARKVQGLAMMDLLVLPSIDTTETFGIAQIEAQFMGLPVIASRLPTGVTDVTIDNVTGLLVPPGDAGALARAIERLTGDRTLAQNLGRAGQDYALRRFTLDAFRAGFADLFEAVLSGQSLERVAARMRASLPR